MLSIERLKKALKDEGRTREWVADQCGIKIITLSSYLKGARQPSLSVVKLLSQTLRVPETELWAESENAKKAS
jgi:transcriptional regulator with XRE-family HTH domain